MVKAHGNQNFCNKGTGHQSRYVLYQNWCPVMVRVKSEIIGLIKRKNQIEAQRSGFDLERKKESA